MGCSADSVQTAWVSKLSKPFRGLNSLILIRESAAKGITRDSAPTFYPAQHQKGTHNQRLTYPSDRPRSSIGLAGLLQPLLLSAVTDNHSLVVACLSLLTAYLLFLDCYPLFVISCDLPLATCHLPLATCHLPLATCHLPLATWFSVR